MREQGNESEWILSSQRSFRLKCGCNKDLCYHLPILQLWWMLSQNLPERGRGKLLFTDDSPDK